MILEFQLLLQNLKFWQNWPSSPQGNPKWNYDANYRDSTKLSLCKLPAYSLSAFEFETPGTKFCPTKDGQIGESRCSSFFGGDCFKLKSWHSFKKILHFSPKKGMPIFLWKDSLKMGHTWMSLNGFPLFFLFLLSVLKKKLQWNLFGKEYLMQNPSARYRSKRVCSHWIWYAHPGTLAAWLSFFLPSKVTLRHL